MTATQDQMNLVAGAEPKTRRTPWSGPKKRGRVTVYVGRLAVLAGFLAAWQYLPDVGWLSHRFRFLDPFFISSPSSAATAIYDYIAGLNGRPLIWPYLWVTVRGSLEGLVIGIILGCGLGLLMSSSARLYDVFSVYINAVNAIPRIALVPIIIAVAGVGSAAEILAAVINVSFVMFFNCLEGGRSVPPAVLDNARVLAVSHLRIMLRIRIRYVSLWAFAAIPNAAAFSILSVIMIEMLAGTGGIGLLLLEATNNIDTTSSVSLIVFLSVTGVTMVRLGELAKGRLLHWADSNQA